MVSCVSGASRREKGESIKREVACCSAADSSVPKASLSDVAEFGRVTCRYSRILSFVVLVKISSEQETERLC